jgi:hypothetical protein
MRVIECRGAPRDLGFDQGVARAREVAACVSGHVPGPLAERVERDVWRHFPHLAERSAGLARGARVSRRSLVRALEAELGLGAPPRSDGIALGLAPERTPSGARLLRVLPEGFLLRRSRPDSGYASFEATLPALPGALAGVNEAGLAATARTLPLHEPAPCVAPAFLLVQHCLQHFDTVEKAVDWCLRRPGGGRASVLFADERVQQGVLLEPERRTHLHGADGLLLAPDPSPGRLPLEKDLAATRVLDGASLRRILQGRPGSEIWLDPVARRLGLLEGPAAPPGPEGVRYLPLR